MKNTYNGWSNYETWCINLWIDNDEGTQRYFQEIVEELKDEEIYELADRLRAELEEMNPLRNDASMWSDLINAALGEVNWFELSESMLQEYVEEKEGE